MKGSLANERGMGLLEVVIAAGLMGVLILGMASMYEAQQKQIKILLQKQEVVDLKNLMIAHLNNPSVCTWQLRDRVIDVSMPTSETSPSPTVLSLTNSTIYGGPNNLSAPLAAAGQRLPNSLHGLVALQVAYRGIYATGNPNEFKGVFEVVFDPARMPMALNPVQVPVLISTVAGDPANAKRISACLGQAQGDLRVEGGSNVGGSTCSGVSHSGGAFCEGAFTIRVNFALPFPSVPKVIVSGRGESIFTYCACCNGAYDQMIVWPENISSTGFDVRTSISPVSGGACAPFENFGAQMAFDWMAVGPRN